jgi:hypothetical protein
MLKFNTNQMMMSVISLELILTYLSLERESVMMCCYIHSRCFYDLV